MCNDRSFKFINRRDIVAPTFTRASNAYYRDGNGVLKMVGPNIQRPLYNDSGELAGMILDAIPASSVIANSNDFGGSGWTPTNLTIGAQVPGPDNVATSGRRVTATAANAMLANAATLSQSSTMTIFARLQSGNGSVILRSTATTQATFNLSTGEITGGSGKIDYYTNGWFRLTHYYTDSAASRLHFIVVTSGAVIDIFGANHVAGLRDINYLSNTTTRPAESIVSSPEGINLVYSSVPQPDTTNPDESSAVMWVAGTYNTGQRVIYDGVIYQVSATPSTTDRPDVGSEKDPKTWVSVSPSNRWKMFDPLYGQELPTISSDKIEVLFMSDIGLDTISLHNIFGSYARVDVYDGSGNLVSSQESALISDNGIIDYWTWFFQDRETQNQAAFSSIPYQTGGYVKLTIYTTQPNTNVYIGKLVPGSIFEVGTTLDPIEIDNRDFSQVNRNDFGNLRLVPGRSVDKKRYTVKVEPGVVEAANNALKEMGPYPTGWIGNEAYGGTLIFGSRVQFKFTYHRVQASILDITIEGA